MAVWGICGVAHVYFNRICCNVYQKSKTYIFIGAKILQQSDAYAKPQLFYIIFSKTHYKGDSERMENCEQSYKYKFFYTY